MIGRGGCRLACDRQGLLRSGRGHEHRGRVSRVKCRHPPLDAQDGEAMVDRRITFVVTLVHEGRQEDGRSVVREEGERNHGRLGEVDAIDGTDTIDHATTDIYVAPRET
jgi:hypothetical protein